MINIGLRERPRFADIAHEPLAQGVVPALDVGGFAHVFAHRMMRLRGPRLLIGVPEIALRLTGLVIRRYFVSESVTSLFTAVADGERDHLVRSWAQGDP